MSRYLDEITKMSGDKTFLNKLVSLCKKEEHKLFKKEIKKKRINLL